MNQRTSGIIAQVKERIQVENIRIKRLEHLGIIAGVIKDLKIIEKIDSCIRPNEKEIITTGEAVAAMIMNSLGFTDSPISLTPQFFENKAMGRLLREGVKASHINRHKLGRSLDALYEYGCDLLFAQTAQEVCKKEGVNLKFNSLDTTSFSVTGEHYPDTDEHAIQMKRGFSKDHLGHLKQVILELMVSQDGGVPLLMKTFDGNESDSKIFQRRVKKLISEFKKSDEVRCLVADSKLYDKTNAENLAEIPFITRIPRKLTAEQNLVKQALKKNEWQKIKGTTTKYAVFEKEHYKIKQRWVVVHSIEAKERAEKNLAGQLKKKEQKLKIALKHLRNRSFNCKEDAQVTLKNWCSSMEYHCIAKEKITEKPHFKSSGRPKANAKATHTTYHIECTIVPDEQKIKERLNEKSCYVLGTNTKEHELSAQDVIQTYKNQGSSVENGFRILKDPIFFVSSFFLKKTSRIMALLTVMTLALLVYSIAQRRLRASLKQRKETIPNQINQPTQTPTLRWTFQIIGGVDIIYSTVRGVYHETIHGLNDLKRRILLLFGKTVASLYGLDSG